MATNTFNLVVQVSQLLTSDKKNAKKLAKHLAEPKIMLTFATAKMRRASLIRSAPSELPQDGNIARVLGRSDAI